MRYRDWSSLQYLSLLILNRSAGGAGSCPSCHWVKAGFTPEKSLFIKGLTYGELKKITRTHIDSNGQFRLSSQPNLGAFGLWEEVRVTWWGGHANGTQKGPNPAGNLTRQSAQQTADTLQMSWQEREHSCWEDFFLPENPLPHNIYLGTGALFSPGKMEEKANTSISNAWAVQLASLSHMIYF